MSKALSHNSIVKPAIVLALAIFAWPALQAQTCTAVFGYTTGPNGTVILLSTSIPSNSTTVISWTLPGATPSLVVGSQPTVSYGTNGIYTVQVTNSTSSPSCFATYSNTIAVTNVNCPVSVSVNWTQGTNGQVFFSASGASSYSWSNGATSANTSSNYSANGTYTMMVIGSNGFPACNDTVVQTFTVTTVCTLNALFTYSAGPNGFVSFSNLTTPTSTSTTWHWDFGDGDSSVAFSPFHNYSANGTYMVILNADDPPCNSSDTVFVTVTGYTCNAAFTHTLLGAGLVRFFDNSLPVDTGNQLQWDFSGTLKTGDSVDHVFGTSGPHLAKLKLTTPYNCVDSTSLVIFPCMLNTSFTFASQQSGLVYFYGQTFASTGTVSYNWDFGDGTNGASVASPVHQYTANGVYAVNLTATDSACSHQANDSVLVNSVFPCLLSAGFTHTAGAMGMVTFSAQSLSGHSIGQAHWDFGDGYTGKGITHNHQYPSAGLYYVHLNAKSANDSLCTDSMLMAINVTGTNCIANAYYLLFPATAANTWSIVPDFPWNVSGATWSWGDGTFSNTLYATHEYTAPGTYDICLTVTTSCGGTSAYCGTHILARTSGHPGHLYINVIRPTPTGVEDLPEGSLQPYLYPSPATELLCLGGIGEGIAAVDIYDVQGRLVMADRLTANACTTAVGNLAPGLYIAHISAGMRTSVLKFLVSAR